MALPPNSEFRGVAAAISQPASQNDISRLQEYITGLTLYNVQGPRILYRDPYNDNDIVEAVYRWDDRSYNEIFRTGFSARVQGSTSNEDYYNLMRHVNGGGAPGETSPTDGSVFVSTTRSTSWKPQLSASNILFCYEIFAPGGIDTVMTIREHNHPNQQEIAFVGGIRPQYIRSAREFAVVSFPEKRRTYHVRIADHMNLEYFNPNPTSNGSTNPQFLRSLRNTVCAGPRDPRVMRTDAVGVEYFIECAFNIHDSQEAHLFFANHCVQINYAPGTTDHDFIIKGPMTIAAGFPYLRDTIFATGIDAAFTSSRKNEAYIFRNNLYALINFVDNGGRIIQGPNMITQGFNSLNNTIFSTGIDAAFASTRVNEAYIFKGDQYAVINFTNGNIITAPRNIILGFPFLRGTVFANGLDAAFSASIQNEAYIFKGDTYARINYAPAGTTTGFIVNGPITPISDGLQSLAGIVPRYSCACDC